MSISVQTPVQIAWVTHDLGSTESMLTALLGARKCTDSPATLAIAVADAAATGAEIVTKGGMPGGMEFTYVSAPAAGVPFVEIAYIPEEIQAFFDHIKGE